MLKYEKLGEIKHQIKTSVTSETIHNVCKTTKILKLFFLFQCPYCNKRFMTAVYLHAHLQRRHQGLPFTPLFPGKSQTIDQSTNPQSVNSNNQQSSGNFQTSSQPPLFSNHSPGMLPFRNGYDNEEDDQNGIPLSTMKTPSLFRQESATQTPTRNYQRGSIESSLENFSTMPKVDLALVSELVEKYLERKSSFSSQNDHLDKIMFSLSGPVAKTEANGRRTTAAIMTADAASTTESSSGSNDSNNVIMTTEEAEKAIGKMKDELEEKWEQLTKKVHQSGIDELKNVLKVEMKVCEQ